MSYPEPNKVPYDPWFDPTYNYIPLDDMPIPTNDRFDMYGSSDADYAYSVHSSESVHQEMYDLSVQNGGSWLGGSENVFS